MFFEGSCKQREKDYVSFSISYKVVIIRRKQKCD